MIHDQDHNHDYRFHPYGIPSCALEEGDVAVIFLSAILKEDDFDHPQHLWSFFTNEDNFLEYQNGFELPVSVSRNYSRYLLAALVQVGWF